MSDGDHRIQRVRDYVEQTCELLELGCKRQSRRHATGTSAKLPPWAVCVPYNNHLCILTPAQRQRGPA